MGVAASLSFDDSNDVGSILIQALRKGDQLKALQLVRDNPACVSAISPQERARIVHSAVKRGHSHVFQFIRDLPADPAPSGSPSASSPTATPSLSVSPATSPLRPRAASRPVLTSSSPPTQSGDGPISPNRDGSSHVSASATADAPAAASTSPASTPAPGRQSGAQTASGPAPARTHPARPSTESSHRPPSQQQDSSHHHNHHHLHLPLPHQHTHQLTRGSWINAVDRRGRTPLVTAVLHNRLECVEGLVSLGADPWIGDRRSGRTTPVHLAAWLGHAPLVAALLKSTVPAPDQGRALVDVQDVHGFTPLHYAAAAGHADVASVLLDAGASYIAASQLPYDPSRSPLLLSEAGSAAARVRVSAAAGLRRRLSSLGPGGGGGRGGDGRLPPCAPRSNPLHLAALRGDGAIASLIVQRYLIDTEGLTRAARDRVPDPRRQLNKDGFQPYMLAGNLGHWHVAQMLIPQSRDNQLITRNRDFLIFFPLPDPEAVAGGSGGGGAAAAVGGGPPSLTELASRAWAAKLLADVKTAEAVVRQRQAAALPHCASAASAASAGLSLSLGRESGSARGGGGGASGALGALLRRSTRSSWVAAAVGGGGGPSAAAVSAAAAIIGSGKSPSSRSVVFASGGGASGFENSVVGGGVVLGGSPEGSFRAGGAETPPRTSLCGGGGDHSVAPPGRTSAATGASSKLTLLVPGGGAPASAATALWPDPHQGGSSRRGTSLDLLRGPPATPAAAAATATASAAANAALVAASAAASDTAPWSASHLRCPTSALRGAPGAAALSSPGAGASGSGLLRGAAAAAGTHTSSPPPPPGAAATPRSPVSRSCGGGGSGGGGGGGSPLSSLFARFPPSPQMSQSSSNLTPLCDVCFEAPQELALRPCPHRLCASCCRRVVEMHCALGVGGAAAAAGVPPGRRAAAVPPRCPFCQATIRGFVPAPVHGSAVSGAGALSTRTSLQLQQHQQQPQQHQQQPQQQQQQPQQQQPQ